MPKVEQLSVIGNIYNWSLTAPLNGAVSDQLEGDGFILSALDASDKLVLRNINDILNLPLPLNIKTFVFASSSSFNPSSYQSNKDVQVLYL